MSDTHDISGNDTLLIIMSLSFIWQQDLHLAYWKDSMNWSITGHMAEFNPLECKGNYSATSNNMKVK